MKRLRGSTVLAHVIKRVQACTLLDEVVVATSESASDDVIAEEAEHQKVTHYRGSEEDVLDRYYQAAKLSNAEVVVRVTADCPLFAPELLTAMLKRYKDHQTRGEKVDYLSNTLERTFPRGLDAEIFLFEALAKTSKEAQAPYEREHVTPYIYQNPTVFRIEHYTASTDNSHLRWTLDTPEDWEFVRRVYSHASEGGVFPMKSVLALLEAHPELTAINSHVPQKSLVG